MPQLLIRTGVSLYPVPDFAAVAECRDRGDLRELAILLDGFAATVDLETGALRVGDERYEVEHPGAPLRPIYYKRMSCEHGCQPVMEFVALGWQTTVDGRNVRFGVKLYPSERRWMLTEEI